MPRKPVEVLPFDRDVRSAKVGAVVGAGLGLLGWVFLLVRDGGTAREAAGLLVMCLSGGAMFGALIPLGPPTRYASARPESKPRLMLLLLVIGVAGVGGVLLGALAAGVTRG